MTKTKIGFIQEGKSSSKVNDCWEKKIGEVTLKYSTEGVIGVGYVHSLHIIQRDAFMSMTGTSFQTTARLSRDEVERRFALAPDVAEFISLVTGVNKDSVARMITKYKGVVCAACGKFWSIGPTYLVERPEQIGADLSLDNKLTCPYCRDTCTYFTSDVVHSAYADGKDLQYQIPRLA
jgi:hypothetical protein